MVNTLIAVKNRIGQLVKLASLAGLIVSFVGLSGCAGFTAGPSAKSSGELMIESIRPSGGDSAGRAETESSNQILLDEDSTIEDYFQIALGNNPGLQAAEQRWQAAVERPLQARSLPDPRISVQADSSLQSRELSVSQTFPWYGKRELRGRVEEVAVRIEAARFKDRKLEVRQELRSVYGDYYYLARSIEIARDNLGLLESFQNIVNTRFATGEISRADVIRVEVETEKQRDRLEELMDQRWPRAAALNRVLGRASSAALPWPVLLPEEAIGPLPEDELKELAQHDNPQLLALRYEIDRRREQRGLAEKDFWPDITVGLMRMEEGMGGMSDDINAAMISINLPLWRDKYEAGLREVEAGLEAGRRTLSDSRYEIEASLENALFNFRDADRRIAVFQEHLLPRAEESLAVSESAYRAAEIDIIELLDAQRELLNFELEVERSKTDRFKVIGEIERLVGRVLR